MMRIIPFPEAFSKSYTSAPKLTHFYFKQIGRKDPRSTVSFTLDAMFTSDLQRHFSKDGRKGKKAFNKNMHYRWL